MAAPQDFASTCRVAARDHHATAMDGGIRVLKAAFRSAIPSFDNLYPRPDVQAEVATVLSAFFHGVGRKSRMDCPATRARLLAHPLRLTDLVNLAEALLRPPTAQPAQARPPVSQARPAAPASQARPATPASEVRPAAVATARQRVELPPIRVDRPDPVVIDLTTPTEIQLTPPPRQRPNPSIQPRRVGDRVLPMSHPTQVFRGSVVQEVPWAGNPYAGFTVPVVLGEGTHFLFNKIVAIVVYNNNQVGDHTYVEMEWAPSLIPISVVPSLALRGVTRRVTSVARSEIVVVGDVDHFAVDGVLEIVRAPGGEMFALVKWANTMEPFATVCKATLAAWMREHL